MVQRYRITARGMTFLPFQPRGGSRTDLTVLIAPKPADIQVRLKIKKMDCRFHGNRLGIA